MNNILHYEKEYDVWFPITAQNIVLPTGQYGKIQKLGASYIMVASYSEPTMNLTNAEYKQLYCIRDGNKYIYKA